MGPAAQNGNAVAAQPHAQVLAALGGALGIPVADFAGLNEGAMVQVAAMAQMLGVDHPGLDGFMQDEAQLVEVHLPGIYEQVQLTPQEIITTARTPEKLDTVRVHVQNLRNVLVPVDLAIPPKDPVTGRQAPLAFFSRYNSTWVQIAAALVYRGPEDDQQPESSRGGLGSPGSSSTTGTGASGPAANGGNGLLKQDASQGSSSGGPLLGSMGSPGAAAKQSGCSAQPRVWLYLTATNPRTGRVDFLERVLELFRFRNGQMPRYRHYNSWMELEATALTAQDPDLRSAISIIQRYGNSTSAVVDAIMAARTNDKNRASYILGTCHKAKGTEEDYVQLADDFKPIRFGRFRGVDEYNLLYVAATRAKVALISNRDIAVMLQIGEELKQVLLQPPPLAAAAAARSDDAVEGLQQTCACCPAVHTFKAVATANVGGIGYARCQEDQPLCSSCVQKYTIWGQLATE